MTGLITITFSSVMNLVTTPIISFKSDRYRGKWGRRVSVPWPAMSSGWVTHPPRSRVGD